MTPWEWDEKGHFWFNRETGEELTPQELIRKHVDAVTRADALAEAVQQVLDDEESQDGGWGPDVTTVGILESALAAYREETDAN